MQTDLNKIFLFVYAKLQIQTIFAVGAGAVTKLVKKTSSGESKILRIFRPKYPYEYLRDGKNALEGSSTKTKEKILEFFEEK